MAGFTASNFTIINHAKNLLEARKIIEQAKENPLNIPNLTYKNIHFYHDHSNKATFIHAKVSGNNVFLNNWTAQIADTNNKEFSDHDRNVAKSTIDHEIGHIEKNHSQKLNKAHFFIGLSSLALVPTLDVIVENNNNVIIKLASVATVATAKFLLDTMYIAFVTRQFEKQADQYAIQEGNIEELEAIAKHYRTLAKKQNPSLLSNLFPTHPPLIKRSLMFEKAANKKTLKDSSKTLDPIILSKNFPSSIDDID
jgi:hypothetical protein